MIIFCLFFRLTDGESSQILKDMKIDQLTDLPIDMQLDMSNAFDLSDVLANKRQVIAYNG